MDPKSPERGEGETESKKDMIKRRYADVSGLYLLRHLAEALTNADPTVKLVDVAEKTPLLKTAREKLPDIRKKHGEGAAEEIEAFLELIEERSGKNRMI